MGNRSAIEGIPSTTFRKLRGVKELRRQKGKNETRFVSTSTSKDYMSIGVAVNFSTGIAIGMGFKGPALRDFPGGGS